MTTPSLVLSTRSKAEDLTADDAGHTVFLIVAGSTVQESSAALEQFWGPCSAAACVPTNRRPRGVVADGRFAGGWAPCSPSRPDLDGHTGTVLSALSPARRRLLFTMVTLVLIAVVLVVVAVMRSGTSNTPTAQVQQSQPGPVLLVPGYGGSTSSLDVLAGRLRHGGRDTTVVSLPGDGTGDLTAQARVLGAAVAAARSRTGAGSVDVVGYSAGGVVARIWAADLGGSAQARRIVTLGSPHHGTQIAGLAVGLLPSQCPVACRQLAPDSPLLAALNRGDETPDGPQWVSIWTTADQVVTPPASASLQGAIDIPVQSVCAPSTVDHANLPRDPMVGAMVAAELGRGPTVRLDPGDCARLSVTP